MEGKNKITSGYDDMTLAEQIVYNTEFLGFLEFVMATCNANENSIWCHKTGKLLDAETAARVADGYYALDEDAREAWDTAYEPTMVLNQ